MVHLQIYKSNCVILKETIDNFKACFYHHSISNCNGDQKQPFVIVNGLLGDSKRPTLPSSDNLSAIATKFNNYFADKIEDVRNEFPTMMQTIDTYTLSPVLSLLPIFNCSCFINVTTADVIEIVSKLKKKMFRHSYS